MGRSRMRRARPGAGFTKGFWIGGAIGASVAMAVVAVTPLVVLAVAGTGVAFCLYRRACRTELRGPP